jgi:AraC family transcriptional regulator, regulatory protein of adaptative response / DNA-3-methyladenine glycosylase II
VKTVLSVHGPFDDAAALAALAAHAVPGLEFVDPAAGTCTRLFDVGGGPVQATIRLGSNAVMLQTAPVAGTAAAPCLPGTQIAAAVRGWLGLDADVSRVAEVLGPDPLLGPLVAARPGLRIMGYADGFEGAVCTVLGQQVSLAAARTFAARLVAAFGAAGPAPGGLRLFPTPDSLAAAGPGAIRAATGLTGTRARTVHALAGACADGLRIDAGGDHADIRRRLLAVPGVGPWTVEYLAMRALRDPDACPEGDLVLKRALGAASVRQASAAVRRWSPLRAYAVFHLWTHHAYLA